MQKDERVIRAGKPVSYTRTLPTVRHFGLPVASCFLLSQNNPSSIVKRTSTYLIHPTLPYRKKTMATRVVRPKKSGSSHLLTAGIPLISMLLGGLYVLSSFMETHYEVKDKKNKSTSTRKFDLDEEHNRMMKQLNIADYKLSRIPRPEEPKKQPEKNAKTVATVPPSSSPPTKGGGWKWW